jgi:hypothetical protein
MAGALVLVLTTNVFAQTNLQFTGVSATDEGAIRLSWASTNHEIYAVQCADALIDTNTGSITWQTLYDNYPSQGTNTFWLDTGNYFFVPPILHPKKMPMRFYRIVDEGADTTSDEPSVSITSPTNDTVVSGELTITVATSTDQATLSTKLYVDGQEMPMAVTSTNYANGSTNYEVDTYTINTCEWGNGTHTLFASAECFSTPEGVNNGSQSLVGHAVSAFVPVTFNNLVTRISFSQPSFDPSSGQTQQVSAVFAANSDWTLNIVNIFSNIVRTATGSGTSMQFNWDGNGNGGTNLPAGVYYYYISAQTNGQAYQNEGNDGDSGGGSGGPPSPSFASASTGGTANSAELFAIPADGSGAAVPFAIYPPGFDTNNLIIFEGSMADILPQRIPLSRTASFNAIDSGIGFASAEASSSGSTAASSQSAPPSPQRPPNNPIRGFVGTVGIAYQRYLSWTNVTGYAPTAPLNGVLSQHVQLQNVGGNNPIYYHSMSSYQSEANNFIAATKQYGLNVTLNKVDDQLNINDLRGSGTPFNNVNLGVLMLHGTYGTRLDYTAGICYQMYFPIGSGGGAQYLRMSEMNLGGAGTNGLKWMAIMACFSLYHTDWQSMQSRGTYPYNGNLHLLLGCDTTEYSNPNLLAYWVKYMAFGTSTNYAPMTIRSAWYQAATDAYFRSHENYAISPLIFAVAGNSACSEDMLQTNYSPSGVWFYERTQVYPAP